MLPLAVTMGEPAGIGGEITLKAWLGRGDGIPPFYLIDDPKRIAALARRLGWNVQVRAIDTPGRRAEGLLRSAPDCADRCAVAGLSGATRPGGCARYPQLDRDRGWSRSERASRSPRYQSDT